MPDAAAPSGPIGILGGTFDPVHRAHLHLARAALKSLRLTQVLWIPAGLPSHRDTPHAAPEHRLAMAQLATADESRFVVDATEALSRQPSFTVPTLERLRAQYGNTQPLVLLVGADAFLGLPTWYRWQELFGLAHIAVAARPRAELDEVKMGTQLAAEFHARRCDHVGALASQAAGCIVGFEIEPVKPVDLSATMVRECLRNRGENTIAADLLPSGVLDYIRRNNLYLT